MSNNPEVVQTFFQLAVEGKIEEAMDLIHPDCKWIYFGPREQIPWAGKVYNGPEGMATQMADSGGKIITFREYADTIKMAGIVG